MDGFLVGPNLARKLPGLFNRKPQPRTPPRFPGRKRQMLPRPQTFKFINTSTASVQPYGVMEITGYLGEYLQCCRPTTFVGDGAPHWHMRGAWFAAEAKGENVDYMQTGECVMGPGTEVFGTAGAGAEFTMPKSGLYSVTASANYQAGWQFMGYVSPYYSWVDMQPLPVWGRLALACSFGAAEEDFGLGGDGAEEWSVGVDVSQADGKAHIYYPGRYLMTVDGGVNIPPDQDCTLYLYAGGTQYTISSAAGHAGPGIFFEYSHEYGFGGNVIAKLDPGDEVYLAGISDGPDDVVAFANLVIQRRDG